MPAPESLVNSLTRLEAALGRLAGIAQSRDAGTHEAGQSGQVLQAGPIMSDPVAADIAARLDGVIDELRHALAAAG